MPAAREHQTLHNWAEDILEKLRAKRAELHQQLSAVEAAVEAIERGYELSALNVPAILKPAPPGNGTRLPRATPLQDGERQEAELLKAAKGGG